MTAGALPGRRLAPGKKFGNYVIIQWRKTLDACLRRHDEGKVVRENVHGRALPLLQLMQPFSLPMAPLASKLDDS